MTSKPPQKMPSLTDAGPQVLLKLNMFISLTSSESVIGANLFVYFLLPRVFSSIFCEKGSSTGQSTVRYEAPPQNRRADHAHGSRSLQEREEAGGTSDSQLPGAREGAGARQQPEHHLLSQTEEILKY